MDGVEIDIVVRALERLAREGYEDVLLQPTHILNGEEYDKRGLIIQALRENLNIPGGEERLAVVYHIKQTELEQLRSEITEIAEKPSVCRLCR